MSNANPSSSENRLAGRVALVSGGAQGIGQAIAALFQQHGASVVILDCDTANGQKTADCLTSRNPASPVRFVQADLREQLQIQKALEAVRTFHGRLDVLINNAGIEIERSLAELTLEEWNLVLDVNLRGAFLLAQTAIPLFPGRGGAIVNISSIHATHAFPDSIPYACSKAGLLALTRNLALELSSRHIRVNCICPGYIDTRLWEEYLNNSANPKALADETTALHPLGRRGIPADVSEAALFLASDASAFITGIDLVVDGGLTLRAHP